MADLTKHTTYSNTKYEILTDEGFKDFKGVIFGQNKNKITFRFSNNQQLTCTFKHKFVINGTDFKYAKDLNVGDTLFYNIKIIDKVIFSNNDPVYEILDVADNHRYIANGVVCRQCLLLDEAAFIPSEFMNDFWESVYPVISSSKKSKIFMLSTPNGVGNLFHQTFTEAMSDVVNGAGVNGWHGERVDWWEIPGRDEKWKEATIRALGSKSAFDQEYGNEFRSIGENVIDNDIMGEFEKLAPEPLFQSEDKTYAVYKQKHPHHFYSFGVDVGEGIGRANSTIQILDITDLTNIEQVAVYANNLLDPFNFTSRLVEIAHEWGDPPLAIERNNCGAQVIDALLHTHHYEKIIKYTPRMGTFTDKAEKDNRIGIYSHTNSKVNAMTNFRYWLSTLRCVKLYDKATIKEFRTYVKQENGVWKKQSDRYLDDRVEGLVWSFFALDNKVIEQYYEVIEKDGNGKPLKIQPLGWDPYEVQETEIPSQEDLYNRYVKRHVDAITGPRNPAFISKGPQKEEVHDDMADLYEQGWRKLGTGNGLAGGSSPGLFF